MILIGLENRKGMNQIDTYYEGDARMSKLASEILSLIGRGRAAEAKLRWEEIHRGSGASVSENLIKGIILAEMGERAQAGEILWKEFDDRPESFIRALHWMMFTMEEEIRSGGEVYDAERFVNRVTEEWGTESPKSYALRSCFALFVSDYPTFLEYLVKVVESADQAQDVYWAYARAAENVEADLPRFLRKEYTEFLKSGSKTFPVDEAIYEALVKSLFIEQDFKRLEKLANSELSAGNTERLSEITRFIFATALLSADRNDEARLIFGSVSAPEEKDESGIKDLFVEAINLNCVLLDCVPKPSVEQLADLEISVEKLSVIIKGIKSKEETPSALLLSILGNYESMIEKIKTQLL